jgi:aromatic ring-opening dioxygenase LigB subunit
MLNTQYSKMPGDFNKIVPLNLFLPFHFQPDSYQQQIILCTNLKEKHFSMGEYKTPTICYA